MKTDLQGVRYVLLDIEGTICPISFVKETLFPYALNALPSVVKSKWDNEAFKPYRDAFPEEHRKSSEFLQAHVEDLTKRDVKVAYHKNLQGYLWEEGYRSGAYSTPLFADVAPTLKKWSEEGVGLAIYSSGSVFAQKLLFEHVQVTPAAATGTKRSADEATEGAVEPAKKSRKVDDDASTASDTNDKATVSEEAGASTTETKDLRHLITKDGWFDTTNAGLKSESKSYNTIIETLQWPPARTLFLTDNVKELDAAVQAGLKSILLDRPGNPEVNEIDKVRMDVVSSLEDIKLSSEAKGAAKEDGDLAASLRAEAKQGIGSGTSKGVEAAAARLL